MQMPAAVFWEAVVCPGGNIKQLATMIDQQCEAKLARPQPRYR